MESTVAEKYDELIKLDISPIVESVISDDVKLFEYANDKLMQMYKNCNQYITNIAAQCGSVNILKCAHGCGYPITESTLLRAIDDDKLECCEYILSNTQQDTKMICAYIAACGKLDILKWMHNRGCDWDYKTCDEAAKNGHSDVLEWASHNGCPMSNDICTFAVDYGHIKCLEIAIINGGKLNSHVNEVVAKIGDINIMKLLYEYKCPTNEYTCANAALYGNYECLVLAHAYNYPWSASTTRNAAMGGHLNCLEFAHKNGCPVDSKSFEYSALNGNASCLAYLFNHAFDTFLERSICECAAEGGHIKCIQIAHMFEYEWGQNTHKFASRNIDCLKYIVSEGCLIKSDAYYETIEYDTIECIRYLFEIGIKMPDDILEVAYAHKNQYIIDYIIRMRDFDSYFFNILKCVPSASDHED